MNVTSFFLSIILYIFYTKVEVQIHLYCLLQGFLS